MRYLIDEQVKTLNDEKELEEALSFYEENDRWLFPFANEIKARGVDDTPLFYQDFMNSVSTTCPQTIFEECVKSAGVFLSIPDGKDMHTFAIRDIALESVYERAGLSCRLLRTLDNVGYVKALSAEKRGAILDIGFKQSDEKVKVLISDEKINTIGSAKYAIMDYREGINTTKDAFESQDDFDPLVYETGSISHEGLMLRFQVTGIGPDGNKEALKALGLDVTEYQFIWSSSHSKMSSMIGRLAMVVNGVTIPVGKAVKVRHMGDPADLLGKFRNGVHKLGPALKENEDVIEKLGNLTIYHPKDCLQQVFEKCHAIPTQAKSEEIKSMPDIPCTGVDIYLAVSRAAAKAEGVQAIINAMEEAASVQYLNLKSFDKVLDKNAA